MLLPMTNDRRSFIGLLLAGTLTPLASACGREATAKESFPFQLSETQWYLDLRCEPGGKERFWTLVATHFPGRTPRCCQERWRLLQTNR